MSRISELTPKSKTDVSLQDIICNSPLMRDHLDESKHQIIDDTFLSDMKQTPVK